MSETDEFHRFEIDVSGFMVGLTGGAESSQKWRVVDTFCGNIAPMKLRSMPE